MNNRFNNIPNNLFNSGFNNKSSGFAPPVFRALSNGSIVPTIGTAGSFQRSSNNYYFPTSPNTVAITGGVTSPAVEAYAPAVASTRGGIFISGFNDFYRNRLLHSETLDNAVWQIYGTGTVTAGASTDPAGGNNGDKLGTTAANSGIFQDTGLTINTNDRYTFGVWLRANSGSRSVDLYIYDTGGTNLTQVTCTVTNVWKFFALYHKFSGVFSGNALVAIETNDTTGYEIYAYGADLQSVNTAALAGIGWSYGNGDPQAYVKNDASVVSVNYDLLIYAGTELTTARNQRSLVCWYYLPNFSNDSLVFEHWLANFGTAASGIAQGAYVNPATGFISVIYGNNTAVSSGALGNKGAWNQIIVASDYVGNTNETFINGVSVHSNSTAYTNLATNGVVIGKKDTNGSNGFSFYNGILSWVEVYDSKLSASRAAALYAEQKGNFGL